MIASRRSSSRAWRHARQTWATPVRAARSTGKRRSGPPDVHVVLYALQPDAERLAAAIARAREVHQTAGGHARSGARTATRCPPRRSHSGSGTASAIRPSRGAAFLAPTPGSRPSRRASSSWAIPTRSATASDARSPRFWAQRHLRRLPQAAPARGGVPPVPAGERCQPGRGGAAGGQDDGALAKRRAAGALPDCRTIPSWAPTRSATTTSSIKKTTRRASRRPAARTSGGRTRATRTSRASCGCTA